VLGWWTIFQLLTRRSAESNTFSIPDRNASWIRTEDDLLVQSVGKCSTSDILGRDWMEVSWEMSGSLPQQCQENYRIVHILEDLTFVFLRVTFRGSPFLRSSHVLTKVADSADSTRPNTPYESPPSPTPSPSPPSSFTHVHRYIGSHNLN
jgi:hypothetical protein